VRTGHLILIALLAGCAPSDQEECRAEAASKARTQDGFFELIDLCEKTFPANRDFKGGYEYQGFPVAGPVPTSEELKNIEKAQQRLQQQQQMQADAAVAASDPDGHPPVQPPSTGKSSFYGPGKVIFPPKSSPSASPPRSVP